jgi:hypothetical protein
MEDYTKDILFKQRVKHLDNLNIETLVIFNKEILDKIEENPNINYKNKLVKLEKYIIKPLINRDANKLYDKLVEILNNSFDIGEDDEIYEFFTREITMFVIMCINSSTFDLEKLVWKEILSDDYYGDGNEDEIIKAIIKKNKKIDVRLFLNYSKYGRYVPFSRFKEIITVDNIPDEINTTTCNYIKNNLTLQYTNKTKINGLFYNGPVIEYKYNENGSIVITNNNKLKVIVKILLNCKSLVLISEYLKETPVFDVNNEDTLYFVGKYKEENREIYELQKEEFKRLLRVELNSRVDSNTRLYIRLRKIIESHTGRSDIVDMKVNSYEKKLKRVIDGESITRS